jgi:hypothetical protein
MLPALSAPLSPDPRYDTLPELSRRAYYLSCDTGWRELCVYDYNTYCYLGTLYTDSTTCRQRCDCQYVGAPYPCKGCNVETDGAAEADGGVEIDGAAEISA